jgi:hypothetical protein
MPQQAIRLDADEARELSDVELCRTYWDFDITIDRLNDLAIPGEMDRRWLAGNECFDVLLSEYGVTGFCDGYNRAVRDGKPAGRVGFAAEISRSILQQGLQERGIDCYTADYVQKSLAAPSGGTREKSRVTEVFDEITESIKESRTTTTTCQDTVYGTVRCRTSKY